MASFSERYGYVKPVEVLQKDDISHELAKSLCSCYDLLSRTFNEITISTEDYENLEKHLWVDFLHERYDDFYHGYGSHEVVATNFLQDETVQWFRKFDLIEKTLDYLKRVYFDNPRNRHPQMQQVIYAFVRNMNHFLKDLNYGYRVVDNLIIPVSSDEEVDTIKKAISDSRDNVKVHLHTALELYSKRPDADYRNSIKESISAIEAFCREQTGESTLGPALKNLEKKGIVIPKMLVVAFEKLYAYTCQPDNGIRHALMDEDGTYVPGQEEAMFMLVSCSAFLNYLYSKMAI